ncbi:VOC family protein [Culicoidibacter larvae]|uniref:VOC family protein n=1 Tax=Culicoidibacter larvae TaxID=2579976 RepID=A0A5R8QFP2_9FIRM|nr:VOC family protein [Culicoidibacter larvae]TLG75283.1 VOC family protein [Culicoidibacter larvae]
MNINFMTLHVGDLAASEKFYTEVLGLKELRRFNAGPTTEILFLVGENGFELELVASSDAEPVKASGVSMGIYVESMATVLAHLEACGVKIEHEPMTVGNGSQLLFVKDPDGFEVEFVAEPANK